MRRSWRWFLFLAAAVGVVNPAVAEDVGSADPAPSLEYRPPRPVLPEPRAPTPAPPVTIFREAIGGYGIGTGSFDKPVDVAGDGRGNIYVVDSGNNRIQMFDSFSNFVLAWGSYGAHTGEFNNPQAILVDSRRPDVTYIFVVDTGNNRIQLFNYVEKRNPKVLFFESWGSLGSRDGDFKNPRDITMDGDGNIWILDTGNDRVQKFKFDPTQLSGPSVSFLNEWGRAFGSRGGIFTDLVSLGWSDEGFGYLYLLGSACLVQQFQLDGTLLKSWSAIAPESGMCEPGRIEVDNKNDYVYVLDAGNGLLVRFNRDGRYLAALRGAERQFSRPLGFAVGSDRDQVLVADTENNIVQKFTLR